MSDKLTNKELRQLLLELGFERKTMVKNHSRVFRHPESKCIIVVPDNRNDDAARLADVLGVKDQLAQHGHLEETVFDRFLTERKLPAA
ncbi:MAG: hypothetical protein AAF939_21615 [Planctomycetota bacterium]